MTVDTEGAGDQEYADEIVGISAYELPKVHKKEFLAWHLPRKQFVRQRQWCEQIARLLNEARPPDGVLKYFGLPGVDLLDIRHFHNTICEPRDLKLRFLGFNTAANPSSAAQTELNVSLDEVKKLDRVDPRSDVIGDDFVRLSNDQSIAWKRTRELGPYDVINLDLCDGFGSHPPSGFEDTHYSALNKLLSLQARYTGPWLLLLTTLAGREHIHGEVLASLSGKFLKNLEDCTPFRERSQALLQISDGDSLRTALGTDAGVLRVFLCGLSKWLVTLALQHQPPTIVSVKSTVGYRVAADASEEDLISIAIRFSPTFHPAQDRMGLAGPSAPAPDECELASKALDRLTKLRNVDKILGDDDELMKTMTDETASLLTVARYDADAYRAWVQERMRMKA